MHCRSARQCHSRMTTEFLQAHSLSCMTSPSLHGKNACLHDNDCIPARRNRALAATQIQILVTHPLVLRHQALHLPPSRASTPSSSRRTACSRSYTRKSLSLTPLASASFSSLREDAHAGGHASSGVATRRTSDHVSRRLRPIHLEQGVQSDHTGVWA